MKAARCDYWGRAMRDVAGWQHEKCAHADRTCPTCHYLGEIDEAAQRRQECRQTGRVCAECSSPCPSSNAAQRPKMAPYSGR